MNACKRLACHARTGPHATTPRAVSRALVMRAMKARPAQKTRMSVPEKTPAQMKERVQILWEVLTACAGLVSKVQRAPMIPTSAPTKRIPVKGVCASIRSDLSTAIVVLSSKEEDVKDIW